MSKRLFGILNIDKPAGMTSRRVAGRVARLARPAKTGHAGTLDPLATGVLVVPVGPATRLTEHVQRQPKEYRATFLLGCRSDTDDITGSVVDLPDAPAVDRDRVERVLPKFVGRVEQVPPQFSAVHVAGRRAYKLARQGKTVDLKPRTVEIHRIDVVQFAYPRLVVDLRCGSGTYVRSIARDLGEQLGTGAVMQELVRTRVGPYTLHEGVQLDGLTRENLPELLLPATTAVEHLKRYVCSSRELEEIRHGRAFLPERAFDFSGDGWIAVVDLDGTLVCLAEALARRQELAPRQVFIS